MKLFALLCAVLSLHFAAAQTGVVYDENQANVQFHVTLWIVLTLITAFILGTYATFQIANTKDSLLYSKINTSSNQK
ncbi:Uncharacterized protein PCOAH_00035470 [Plasmodium coatneyi]|uniref:CcmD family protein n=1 Tax=Plasmodium coatneyi TaxID=208452 RepID=A0A1B1E1S3_9APIC|nr:Uncharacterized protein PCOAH_00035470 [Plasmodium coatneyi]ANQ08875.1 Uncharacterized protein PCOAH_00035470 [Plasmodium coatneyi]